MVFAAVYAIVVGAGMFGQWAFFLGTKRVPELETEPFRIGFHLAGEFLTAIALLIGGAALLLYTAIVSPGYFAQRREWPLVGMFAVLLVLAAISLILVL